MENFFFFIAEMNELDDEKSLDFIKLCWVGTLNHPKNHKFLKIKTQSEVSHDALEGNLAKRE